jgi:hypothetical protein
VRWSPYLALTCLLAACVAHAQCIAPAPIAPGGAVTEDQPARNALQALSGDMLNSPCKDPTGVAAQCQAIATDLKNLADAADNASLKLKYCASFGAAGSPLAASVADWYRKRAALWDLIDTQEKANLPTFSNGSFILPAELTNALSIPYNVVQPASLTKLPAGDPTGALEQADKTIRAAEAPCIKRRDADCLSYLGQNYQTFFATVGAVVNVPNSPQPSAGQNWFNDYIRLKDIGESSVAPFAPPPHCVGPQPICDGRFAFSLGDFTGNVSHVRVMAGVDVSAASSTDPAAKFLGDASLDIPIPLKAETKPIEARNWLWGYARISSIAQPGAVSGVSNLPTYVQGLASSTPNNIVQSFETTFGYELKLFHALGSGWGRRPILISSIVDGGIITPISTSQTNPTVYVASPAIQAYYLNLAQSDPSTVNTENGAAISANCPTGTPPPASPVCYIAQYPTDRSRFFHNYAGGFRLKRYYYNETNESFDFPANFDLTVGQNDYVTSGRLRYWVAHFGGSTPIAGFPGLYVYAAFDIELSKNNAPNQQFILSQAPSTVTPTSQNVASIFVNPANRDRYRFGAAYDIMTLIKKLTPASK